MIFNPSAESDSLHYLCLPPVHTIMIFSLHDHNSLEGQVVLKGTVATVMF